MASDLRALSREWFEFVWNRRDEGALNRLADPNVICHGLGDAEQPRPGIETFKQVYRNFLAAFPDLRFTVDDVLQDGDKTAVRVTFSGSHHGQGLGIPSTNRPFTSTAITIIHWRNGRIIEAWNEFDAAGMMRQLQAPTAKLRAGE